MKQKCCESCFFDKHETLGCAAQQLSWAVEDLFMSTPLTLKLYELMHGTTEHSRCEWFEPIEMEDEA